MFNTYFSFIIGNRKLKVSGCKIVIFWLCVCAQESVLCLGGGVG